MNKRSVFLLVVALAMCITACAKSTHPEAEEPDFLETCGMVTVVDEMNVKPVILAPETPEPTEPAPEHTEEPESCPISGKEIIMLAKAMTAEAQVLVWNGDRFGVSYLARQAAVAWVALNRLDAGKFGGTLAEVLTKPNQFAYDQDIDASDEMLWLALDVVGRWWAEKQGVPDVGRTIPADYKFFDGDGRENYFRKEYEHTGEVWDWSLPDPYR